MQHVGIISTHRCGKHLLLAGIFDTLNVYPENYLQFLNNPFYLSEKTSNYSIIYNDKFFTASHFRLEPYFSSDKYILLDRKDIKKQALSFTRVNIHHIPAIYDGAKLEKAKKFINSIYISPARQKYFEKNLIIIKQKIHKSLEGINYKIIYYEDLIKNFEEIVKEVLEYLFEIKEIQVKCNHKPFKLSE